jgi:hypothetical protein
MEASVSFHVESEARQAINISSNGRVLVLGCLGTETGGTSLARRTVSINKSHPSGYLGSWQVSSKVLT